MSELELSEDDRRFVEEQVATGRYRDAQEVVAAGLRLLGSEQQKLAELRRLLQEGADDLNAGRLSSYGTADDMLADLKRMTSDDTTGTRY